jgi:hypothetical protein
MLSLPIYLHDNLKMNVLCTRYTILDDASDVSFSQIQIAGMLIESNAGYYTVQSGVTAIVA